MKIAILSRAPRAYSTQRLTAAARVAKKGKFDCFTSTLLYSKFQNHAAIREIGDGANGYNNYSFIGYRERPTAYPAESEGEAVDGGQIVVAGVFEVPQCIEVMHRPEVASEVGVSAEQELDEWCEVLVGVGRP